MRVHSGRVARNHSIRTSESRTSLVHDWEMRGRRLGTKWRASPSLGSQFVKVMCHWPDNET